MGRGAPYVRRLDEAGGVTVWRVDGAWIRDRLDVEFTNGHHHYSRSYVPRDEIWLDREGKDGPEWPFWALRQRIERAMMAAGTRYLAALETASRVEARERRLGRPLVGRPDAETIRAAARIRRLGDLMRREVWLVNGRAVRDLAYVDFTLGGHGYRYRFIPRGEIWIDDAVRPGERASVLHHEGIEVAHMAGGMLYEEAHRLASRAEQRYRRARLAARNRATVLANVGP